MQHQVQEAYPCPLSHHRQATVGQFSNSRPTIDGLERTRDTLLWQLEASAHELGAILSERLGTERYLTNVESELRELRAQAGAGGDEGDGGYSGGDGDGGDAEGENESEEIDEVDEAVDQLQE